MPKSTVITNPIFVPKLKSGNFLDFENQTFGRLTVQGFLGFYNKSSHWCCKCICGNLVDIRTEGLRFGTKSCGCLMDDAKTTHGKSRTTEYRAYCAAKARCENPRKDHFAEYGGRGIKFLFESFEEFFAELGDKPSPQHSLDRINNNGHYEKGNVQWSQKVQQMQNRRNTRWITLDGITRTMTDWAKDRNMDKRMIHGRTKRGWCDNCAVLLPTGQTCSHKINF